MPYTSATAKREHDAAYRLAHRDHLAAQERARYRENRPRLDARNRRYLELHPDLFRMIHYANRANQRARRWGVPGKLSVKDLRSVTGPCVYCGGEQQTWDHRISMWRGGPNTVANLVPACRKCNRRKSRWDTLQPLERSGAA